MDIGTTDVFRWDPYETTTKGVGDNCQGLPFFFIFSQTNMAAARNNKQQTRHTCTKTQ